MNAFTRFSPETMHRGAKLFMDRGDAPSYGEALGMLERLRLDIAIGEGAACTEAGQIALLTAVNLARRTMLGGVRVICCPDEPCLTRLGAAATLRGAVLELGGMHSLAPVGGATTLVIGDPAFSLSDPRGLRVTWSEWSGGVVPIRDDRRLSEPRGGGLGPVLAAAIAVGDAFQSATGETPDAGRRAVGLSLWNPGACWMASDPGDTRLAWLPSRLWLIGLGNLGQAFLWCLGALPYSRAGDLAVTLQDDDVVQPSNDSTSVLTSASSFGKAKARMAAAWAEGVGFRTRVVERRFGPWTRRADEAGDPAVALCGVDNALARMGLEDAGFAGVFEAGLGAGPQGYLNLATHAFPGAARARDIWSRVSQRAATENPVGRPAYEAAAREGMGQCGLLTLATRTVGVPFVGVAAATLVIAEILRRIHGGAGLDACSLSLSCPGDAEVVEASTRSAYLGGTAPAAA
ncbi:hypothetical protein DFH01_09725 [Falsiroseomonas bella]|uniref:THIF-type NAD/FAD binding fold domain-containing protein n=1 Tax=Falsiroseomonas bella TaxID=2184016 RepID=A0A317FGH3_9PROT|nr:ThiF family adenylyltransferase [Falsiroseomonas bella]PWS37137.1 hypothetical protein DFH01_09725 [Falsiroseomonas bella]